MNPRARHDARRAALHAIYQYQMTNKSILDIMSEVLADPYTKVTDIEYFQCITQGTVTDIEEINQLISPVISRPIADVSPLELAILRIAVFELRQCLQTPYPVVLNEAIELAKKYASSESYKFVNAALDQLIPILRQHEKKFHDQ